MKNTSGLASILSGKANADSQVHSALAEVVSSFKKLLSNDRVSTRDQIAFLRVYVRPLKRGASEREITNYLLEHGNAGVKKIAAVASGSITAEGKITSDLGIYFPPFYTEILKTMESTQGAKFADSLDVVADMMATGRGMFMKLFKYSLFPLAYLLAICFMIVFVYADMVPQLREFTKSQAELDVLENAATFIQFGLIPTVVVLVAVGVALRQLLRRLVTPWRVKHLDTTILSVYRDYVAYGYLTRFALLKSAGLDGTAIFNLLSSTGSPYERWHANASGEQLKAGAQMEEFALDTGLLSPSNMGLVKLMITRGETDEIAKSISSSAVMIEESLQTKINILGIGISVVLWLILARLVLIVGVVVVGLDAGI